MRAVTFSKTGGAEVLEVFEVADRTAGAGEVLVQVQAASINPIDVAAWSGKLPIPKEFATPWITGWDAAGTVIATGAGVDPALVGQLVVGFSPWFDAGNGTHASLVALPVDAVAVAPDGIPAEQATTLGLNALTAYQAVEAAGLTSGQTLLVSGAAGAVGGFAVELAAGRGIRVFAMAGDDDHDAVLGFGAEARVPRDAAGATAAVRKLVDGGVDAVVDTVPLPETIDAVRDGGRWVTVKEPQDEQRGITVTRVSSHADAAQLADIMKLAGEGHLTLRVDKTFDAADAADAWREVQKSHRGRIVLTF